MTWGCLIVVAVGFGFPPVLSVSASEGDFGSKRSITEIRRDVQAFVKRSRAAKSNAELTDAIIDMCRLHREIVQDSRFKKSKDLQGYRGQLWQRLTTIKKSLEAKIKRQKREIAKQLKAQGLKADEGTIANAIQENQPSMNDFDDLVDRISQQMTYANQTTGGAANVFAMASGRWAGPPDNGPALVRLIEETINPDFWERNGGPGRIHYYKPLQIIVVTGTMDVQNDLSKLLRTLRFLSR